MVLKYGIDMFCSVCFTCSQVSLRHIIKTIVGHAGKQGKERHVCVGFRLPTTLQKFFFICHTNLPPNHTHRNHDLSYHNSHLFPI